MSKNELQLWIQTKSAAGYPVTITAIEQDDEDCLLGEVTTPALGTVTKSWNCGGIIRDGHPDCNLDLSSPEVKALIAQCKAMKMTKEMHMADRKSPDLKRGLMCEVRSLAYDYVARVGQLVMEPGNCCDMDGCLLLFCAIDPEVREIRTFAADLPDTVYYRSSGQWKASR